MHANTPPSIKQYICKACSRSLSHVKRSNRSFATSTSERHPPLSGAAKLTNRRLISVHGNDAPKFLQGIITNNVHTASQDQSGFFAAFLTAQGKVLHDVFIYPTSSSKWQQEQFSDNDVGYLIEVDAEQAEHLFKHLRRHKLRSKLSLRLLENDELNVWSIWREDERWTAHTRARTGSESIGLSDCRAPGMGQRLLLSSTTAIGVIPELEEVEETSLEAYTIRRYLRGIPEGQAEIPREESLPMNYNMDLMGGIDFKKGCYVGQELTIRTHHTGVVRRRILPVSIYAQQAEPESLRYDADSSIQVTSQNNDILKEKENGGKRATGKLVASVGNVGLAMCRLEQMSDLVVSSEASSFKHEDVFLLRDESGSGLRVKPFVPDWIRGRIREPKLQRRVE